MNVGEAINSGMKRKGISQRELAEMLNVSQPNVAKWVSGKMMPRADKMIEIIKILDLRDEFFPEEDEPCPEKEEKKITVDGDVIQHLFSEIEDIKKQINEVNDDGEYEEVSKTMKELRLLAAVDDKFAKELNNFLKVYKKRSPVKS